MNPTAHTSAPGSRRAARTRARSHRADVQLREGHRHQSLERPARALAQHRDRRDEEHQDEREQPAQRRADALEGLRLAVEHVLHQHQQQARHREEQRERPGSRRICHSTRRAVARSLGRHAQTAASLGPPMIARNALPRSLLAGALAQLRAAVSARASPRRASAAARRTRSPRPSRGLRSAAWRRRRRARGTCPTAPRGAPGPDPRSARRASADPGASQQRRGKRHAGALAAGH